MTGRLAGKVALITGTAGGQGRAVALLFAAEGAKVVGTDVNAAGAAETVELVRAAGGRMDSTHPLHLSYENGVRSWVDGAAHTHGGIDIVYNNAGATRFPPVAQTSYADWSFVMRNELDIVFLVTEHARPHLVARGGGSVLLVGSTAGITGSLTNPRVAHTATKGGRRDDQAAGRRGSRAPHPGQLHQPRHDPHIGHRERPARPGLADAHHPARPDRCSGGGRPVRPVPGLRRGLLRHRANLVVDGGWSAVLPGAC